jgi:hypothetical protein
VPNYALHTWQRFVLNGLSSLISICSSGFYYLSWIYEFLSNCILFSDICIYSVCMQVQNTQAGKRTSEKKKSTNVKCNNSDFNICYQVEPNSTISKSKTQKVKDNCKIAEETFKKLSESVLNDETRKVKCWENKEMKCKKCYCVCCNVEPLSVQPPTLSPVYNKGYQT